MYTIFNLKLIKNLNIRPETIKLLEENIGRKLLDIGLGSVFFFFPMTLKVQATKAKVNKWDYIKPKTFFTATEIINKMVQSGRKYLPTICLIMCYYPETIIRNSYNSVPKSQSD